MTAMVLPGRAFLHADDVNHERAAGARRRMRFGCVSLTYDLLRRTAVPRVRTSRRGGQRQRGAGGEWETEAGVQSRPRHARARASSTTSGWGELFAASRQTSPSWSVARGHDGPSTTPTRHAHEACRGPRGAPGPANCARSSLIHVHGGWARPGQRVDVVADGLPRRPPGARCARRRPAALRTMPHLVRPIAEERPASPATHRRARAAQRALRRAPGRHPVRPRGTPPRGPRVVECEDERRSAKHEGPPRRDDARKAYP